ncbi:cation transporter [Geitlerinema sp. P-1104]|uniref:cation diffusion facilitator family transporter n=1 Tax=Geitlerinema sp. P-1104 TaxID=2546230 RepID=UPI0014776EC2|nr:cation diffusion facilitator family transporter [Geitlerinema sp. P-1104]NMG58010.1 cation transporter [Geitlerinema sp. P-1104]
MVVDHRPQVQRVLMVTLGLNLLVVAIKASLGWWTGSLSLVADALHSTTDGASNILGLITTRLSSPEPDREHPYGHQKFEAIGALGIAAFLGAAFFEIVKGVLERLFAEENPVTMSPLVLWLMLLVLGVNILVTYYERRVGLKLGSNILIADAHHTMSDVWITITVMLGLIGVWLGYPQLDIILAVPVAGLVFHSGWQVLRENLPWLIDEMAIAPEAIHRLVMEVPGVINCHDIASRGLNGRQLFVEMHVVVDAKDLATAHSITEKIEARLEERFAPIRLTIHMEPPNYQSDQISYGEQTSQQVSD